MSSHYHVLRINPEKDILGKNESDIKNKIESNYKTLLSRISQLNTDTETKDKAIKEIEEAKAVLSDKEKRELYDNHLKTEINHDANENITIQIDLLTDIEIQLINDEILDESGRDK